MKQPYPWEGQWSPSKELVNKLNEIAEELSEVWTKFTMDLWFWVATFEFDKKASIYNEEEWIV